MTTALRPELDLATMPERMRRLPIDERGYPVPWFVEWLDGKPEFRVMDPNKFRRAIHENRCWVCGEIRGRRMTFVVGPMCGLNRTTSEPPCHLDCAVWSVRNCPFLTRPHMVRREDDRINVEACAVNVAGDMIARNPGATLVWTTRSFEVFNDARGLPLIQIGEPDAVAWYYEGRPATRAEVAHSVDTGIPLLEATIAKEATPWDRRRAVAELQRRHEALVALYPE